MHQENLQAIESQLNRLVDMRLNDELNEKNYKAKKRELEAKDVKQQILLAVRSNRKNTPNYCEKIQIAYLAIRHGSPGWTKLGPTYLAFAMMTPREQVQ